MTSKVEATVPAQYTQQHPQQPPQALGSAPYYAQPQPVHHYQTQQQPHYIQQQQLPPGTVYQQPPPNVMYTRNNALIAQYQKEIEDNNLDLSDACWFICCGPFALICCLPKYNAQQRAKANLAIELSK
ncbi:hypothetical protein BGZ94_009559 [Podila epigama]|nr:hypothetical protein BGZ94_009559 [Podila epigama]